MKQAIERALLTWYPKDHPLHFNPHHPLGKLLGEWGELLDDYMKGLYKPGYVFNPEDELGDIWYYIRILCYQRNHKPAIISVFGDKETDYVIVDTMHDLAHTFISLAKHETFGNSRLNSSYAALVEIARRYNLTLDQLTASNWEKLKPGSARGDEWEKARELYHSKH